MATPSAAKHRDLEARFRNLEAAVSDVRAALSKRPKFEVSSGDLTISGGDLVVDGGDFLLLDTDGSTVFRLGPQEHGDRGVSLYREDGAAALTVKKLFSSSTDQIIEIRDRHGNLLMGEAGIGAGMTGPSLAIPFVPVQATSGPLSFGPHGPEVTTSDSAWTTVFSATFPRHNQFASVAFQVKPSDVTTAGELRVRDRPAANVLGEFAAPDWVPTIPAGVADYQEVSNGVLYQVAGVNDETTLDVQVRRTAGAGSLTVAVSAAYGTIAG